MTVNHWVAGSSPARGASSKMPIYSKDNTDPYKLSRTRIENFCRCKKCFYLEEKLGISRPASFPFNLNNAVDELLKEEFDSFKPLIEKNKSIDKKIIYEWTGQLLIGDSRIMNLEDSKKFV